MEAVPFGVRDRLRSAARRALVHIIWIPSSTHAPTLTSTAASTTTTASWVLTARNDDFRALFLASHNNRAAASAYDQTWEGRFLVIERELIIKGVRFFRGVPSHLSRCSVRVERTTIRRISLHTPSSMGRTERNAPLGRGRGVRVRILRVRRRA